MKMFEKRKNRRERERENNRKEEGKDALRTEKDEEEEVKKYNHPRQDRSGEGALNVKKGQ